MMVERVTKNVPPHLPQSRSRSAYRPSPSMHRHDDLVRFARLALYREERGITAS